MRRYLEQESTALPAFYHDRVQNDLGPFWERLPKGALDHDLQLLLPKAS